MSVRERKLVLIDLLGRHVSVQVAAGLIAPRGPLRVRNKNDG